TEKRRAPLLARRLQQKFRSKTPDTRHAQAAGDLPISSNPYIFADTRLDLYRQLNGSAMIVPYIIAIVVILYLIGSLRVLRQYERGVVFLLGKFAGVRGAGLTMVFIPVQ